MTSEVATTENATAFTDKQIEDTLRALATVEDQQAMWAEVSPDFGTTFDFKEAGDTFVGMLVGRKIVPLPDLENPAVMRDAPVYEFIGTDEERYSIWGSYSIDAKLKKLPDGAVCKIEFKGFDEFKADNGEPRRVRRYKVSVAAALNTVTTALPTSQEVV